jgi:hypothetical protein
MITRRDSISLVLASTLGISGSASADASEDSERSSKAAEGASDPSAAQPYIDIDEWRDTPVRHRYVHGGFKGTDTLFSMYFPPKERYEGRFFQHLQAVAGNEVYAQLSQGGDSDIGFSVASGGYFVESNQGKKDMFPSSTDDALNVTIGYRASAAVAQYSRVLAAQMYGKGRVYGYVFGGSGGCYKTLSCFENTVGVWDGAVPYIPPSPMAAPNMFTVQNHALRILKDKMPAILDAIDPGGSGDMYAGLNRDEHDALLEVTRMGFPPRTWFIYQRLGMGPLSTLIDHLKVWDPHYFTDFWTVRGYLGANPPESLLHARVQHKTAIRKIVMSDEARKMGLPLPMAARAAGSAGIVPAGFQVDTIPNGDLVGAGFILQSGKELFITAVVGDVITVGFGPDAGQVVNGIKVGDEVRIDNSVYLATQTYHRHQVPTSDYYTWDQFRAANGKELYPQRSELSGPRFNRLGGGTVEAGRFSGKMIVVASLMDEYAYPWNADWYRSKVKEAMGAHLDDNYRLWYTDHALHGGPALATDNTRVINYVGVLQQALRDLSAWVEKNVAPPPSTTYKVADGQIVVPTTAAERKGIQPVVVLTANGAVRAEVAVGEPVTFVGNVEVPPNTGNIIAAEWDFEGGGNYPVAGQLSVGNSSHVTVKTSYSFSKPGTYFPALRATSQRQGDSTSLYARIRNLGRVRVVVK